MRILVGGVERIHQAVAEGIGIDVERRMDEMRDVGPVVAVGVIETNGRTEALALHLQPDVADALCRQLGLAARVMYTMIDGFVGDPVEHRCQTVHGLYGVYYLSRIE